MAKTEHEQVHLRAGRHSVSVDPHIALLIGNLWQRGIETVSSCQEDRPGWVWIEFATARDAERFLNLVARFEPEPNLLFRRILRSRDRPVDDLWEYELHPADFSFGSQGVRCADMRFPVSVRFPKSDLPVVEQRVSLDDLVQDNVPKTTNLAGGSDNSQAAPSEELRLEGGDPCETHPG